MTSRELSDWLEQFTNSVLFGTKLKELEEMEEDLKLSVVDDITHNLIALDNLGPDFWTQKEAANIDILFDHQEALENAGIYLGIYLDPYNETDDLP